MYKNESSATIFLQIFIYLINICASLIIANELGDRFSVGEAANANDSPSLF
jgi:hypothetical protein